MLHRLNSFLWRHLCTEIFHACYHFNLANGLLCVVCFFSILNQFFPEVFDRSEEEAVTRLLLYFYVFCPRLRSNSPGITLNILQPVVSWPKI